MSRHWKNRENDRVMRTLVENPYWQLTTNAKKEFAAEFQATRAYQNVKTDYDARNASAVSTTSGTPPSQTAKVDHGARIASDGATTSDTSPSKTSPHSALEESPASLTQSTEPQTSDPLRLLLPLNDRV
jgi:hypothetical protein